MQLDVTMIDFILIIIGLILIYKCNIVLINEDKYLLWVFLAPYGLIFKVLLIKATFNTYMGNSWDFSFYTIVTIYCCLAGLLDVRWYYKFKNKINKI
jgi:hypothetical protein